MEHWRFSCHWVSGFLWGLARDREGGNGGWVGRLGGLELETRLKSRGMARLKGLQFKYRFQVLSGVSFTRS